MPGGAIWCLLKEGVHFREVSVSGGSTELYGGDGDVRGLTNNH